MATVNLPQSVEQRLKGKAARSGVTLEEFLLRLAVREAQAPEPAGSDSVISYPPEYASRIEWSKALREWAASHPRVDHFVDDSRESIYAGRGG